MIKQQRDDLLDGSVVVGVQAELGEALVLTHQLRRRDAEQPQNTLETGAVERLLQVFDGVELDASLAQDLDRAARLPSTGIVVDREHRCEPIHYRNLLSSSRRASKIIDCKR